MLGYGTLSRRLKTIRKDIRRHVVLDFCRFLDINFDMYAEVLIIMLILFYLFSLLRISEELDVLFH